ncbi:MAG: YhdH/YhfP family quinone oxidoreductase [bacterium]|nr:YhdH/YhfP family quinone oxidoreductase [bacterium]
MIPQTFTAFYVDENHNATVTGVKSTSLPDHEVSIQVHFSSLNYKDALSARGLNRVTKNYPHIPGIDAAGVVVEDRSGTFAPGDKVIVTGNDLGTNTFGGFGAFIRVPASWVVALPKELSLEQSMMIGTAGFTALYGIHRLKIEGINPDGGPILVTGATGGVGSFSVFALSAMGYQVEAATRKTDQAQFLKNIGANSILESEALTEVAKHPLLPRKWQGCIDTVGGELLDTVLRQVQPKGAVACCGNVLGIEVSTNILPFILRGISLLGIDSAFCKRTIREQIWETASTLPFHKLPSNYYKKVPLSKLGNEIDLILQGKQTGRVVIEHAQ